MTADELNRIGDYLGLALKHLDRIATALEQLVLEEVAADTPVTPQGRPHAEWVGQPAQNPMTCPVHGKPFRNGKFGWYCATKMADGSWCQMKPPALQAPQLP